MTDPNNDDVVVRFKRGNPSAVYALGTLLAPDQFIVPIRGEAVSQAVAYAKSHRVRVVFRRRWIRAARDVSISGGECHRSGWQGHILSGSVHSWAERQEAERVAWAAPGVSQVDDRLASIAD